MFSSSEISIRLWLVYYYHLDGDYDLHPYCVTNSALENRLFYSQNKITKYDTFCLNPIFMLNVPNLLYKNQKYAIPLIQSFKPVRLTVVRLNVFMTPRHSRARARVLVGWADVAVITSRYAREKRLAAMLKIIFISILIFLSRSLLTRNNWLIYQLLI